jgi:extracellular factor (EF) 3-hydroxypalmitic acid methyl ester biosynthesis protein
MLEFVLDWHLIYRGIKQSAALLPQRAVAEHVLIHKDPTEVNVFFEVRKPEHG